MRTITGVTLAFILVFYTPSLVSAQTSSSANYSVEESSFSSGSGIGTSASFSSQASAGNVAVGSAFSTTYDAYAGPISPNEEYLELVVSASTISLGTLDNLATSSGSAEFYVRAYLNNTYTVQILGDEPTLTSESNDSITALAATTASIIGTEQFGINLKNNTTPDIGAEAVPQPNSTYANGEAAPGYDVVDQFKFVQSDIIAQSGAAPAWGQTNFTISYIANISSVTEAGFYQLAHSLVVVPTF